MTKTLVNYTIDRKKVYRVTCEQCSVMVINNHICHERGCINAYRDEIGECTECGVEFTPDNNHQQFCSDTCYAMYNGFNLDTDESEE